MGNVSIYTNYFKNLAIKHKDILHNDNTIGGKGFTRWTVEEAIVGVRTKLNDTVLLLELFEEMTSSQDLYNVRGNFKGAFSIVCQATHNNFQQEIEAFDKAYIIVKEILKKIWQDHYAPGTNSCNNTFKDFDFNGIDISPISNILNNAYVGWRCEFSFSFKINDDITGDLPNGTFID